QEPEERAQPRAVAHVFAPAADRVQRIHCPQGTRRPVHGKLACLFQPTPAMPEILVLYYSRGGSVARLARRVARGVGEVAGMVARLRTVPPVAAVTTTAAPPVPDDGAPYV